jgi:dipeptidyl aminopeptidase/acylaminoacyl peptidase
MADLARFVAPTVARFADVDAAGSSYAYLCDRDTETAQLWLQRARAEPARASDHADAVAFAAFRPARDGESSVALVYGIDGGGDEKQELHLLDLGAGRAAPLAAAPGARQDFGAFRRDGAALAMTSNAANGVDVDVIVVPLDAGGARCVLRGQGLRRVEAWSPCGRFLAVVAEHAALREELHLLDLATGALRPLLGAGPPAIARCVRFLPDGDLLLVTDAGRDRPGVARIARSDGGLAWWFTADVDVDRIALARDGGRLAVTLNHEGFTTIELHDLQAGGTPVRFALDGVASGLAWHPRGSSLLATVETPTTPPRPWWFDADGRDHGPMPGFAAPEPVAADPDVVRIKSFDGRRLPALLYRPARAPEAPPAPAVMTVHGGPESQWRPGWHGDVAAMLERGWTVLAPNLRGSTGYGRVYASLDDGAGRVDVFADLAALGGWLGARDEVEPAQVALVGQSYGGFVTLAGLARYPEFWCGGVAFYGMADLRTFLRDTAAYRRAHRIAEYGDPTADAELLAELSPLGRADAIRAPVLLAHGLEDPRVASFESRQMAAALEARGQPVEHIEVAAEGHGFAKRANRIEVWRRALAFLAACFDG